MPVEYEAKLAKPRLATSKSVSLCHQSLGLSSQGGWVGGSVDVPLLLLPAENGANQEVGNLVDLLVPQRPLPPLSHREFLLFLLLLQVVAGRDADGLHAGRRLQGRGVGRWRLRGAHGDILRAL